MKHKIWIGTSPIKCDLCKEKISLTFIDGKTIYGPWAFLCPTCHSLAGCGLGIGRGQKYNYHEETMTWRKEVIKDD